MAKRGTTKVAVENNITDIASEVIVDTAENNMNKENVETPVETIKVESLNDNNKNEPLKDSDEIDVISLIPNVSYKDNRTLDIYEWAEVGHIEPMTFETLKNMWRNHKGYFKNMWLKPDDNRIIKKFGLTPTFEKYEYLMDASNYTKDNIKAICDTVISAPNGLKFSVCNKIKSLVVNGEITDVSIIKTLENRLKIDLIEFL